MNLPTFVILAIVVLMAAWSIRTMIKNKKEGKSFCGCSGGQGCSKNCPGCSLGQGASKDPKKETE